MTLTGDEAFCSAKGVLVDATFAVRKATMIFSQPRRADRFFNVAPKNPTSGHNTSTDGVELEFGFVNALYYRLTD